MPLFIYEKIVRKSFEQVDTIEDVNLSFYDCFMEITEDICNGYYDDQIMDFDSNVFDKILRMNCKIEKRDLEELKFNPENKEYYEDSKRFTQDDLDLCKENVMDYMTNFNLMNPILKEFKKLRSHILYSLFIKQNFPLFYYRKKDISKEDIKKVVMEYNDCNDDKQSFAEDVSYYNSHSIGVDLDYLTVTIDKAS
ncbi:unnamed protein product, partial [marine sediment metagenome]